MDISALESSPKNRQAPISKTVNLYLQVSPK
jgi:hypothetical protein